MTEYCYFNSGLFRYRSYSSHYSDEIKVLYGLPGLRRLQEYCRGKSAPITIAEAKLKDQDIWVPQFLGWADREFEMVAHYWVREEPQEEWRPVAFEDVPLSLLREHHPRLAPRPSFPPGRANPASP